MKDQFGRNIDYIRISVTDRCNLRCRYCMPECGIESVGHDRVLRFDEILRLVNLFAKSGIRKVKITGGEPTVRKGLASLIRDIKKTPGIEQVTMTTNGIAMGQRPELIGELVQAGLDGVNMSLDTLDADKYETITGTDGLTDVLRALDGCCSMPGLDVKVNTVTLADYNQDEIEQLAGLARDRSVDVRFIEMMPMGLGRDFAGYGQDMILERLQKVYGPAEIYKGTNLGNGPAVYYEFGGFCGRVGFISAMTHMFCGDCNRVRLTSEGFLKPCLQYAEGIDLRQLLRGGAGDEAVLKAIEREIYRKPRQHCFNGEAGEAGQAERCEACGMSFIGG